jgi:hypothetical protein
VAAEDDLVGRSSSLGLIRVHCGIVPSDMPGCGLT